VGISAELELAEKKGLIVFVDDVAEVVGDAQATTRVGLLNLPRRVAPLLLGETDGEVVESILTDEIDQLIQELHTEFSNEYEALGEDAS